MIGKQTIMVVDVISCTSGSRASYLQQLLMILVTHLSKDASLGYSSTTSRTCSELALSTESKCNASVWRWLVGADKPRYASICATLGADSLQQ
jgi:hypothetical protein